MHDSASTIPQYAAEVLADLLQGAQSLAGDPIHVGRYAADEVITLLLEVQPGAQGNDTPAPCAAFVDRLREVVAQCDASSEEADDLAHLFGQLVPIILRTPKPCLRNPPMSA